MPAMALGQLVGVLAVESRRSAAFTAEPTKAPLTVVASLVANAVERERVRRGGRG